MMTAVVGVMGVWVTAGASWGIGATVAVALLLAFWAESCTRRLLQMRL